MSWTFVHNCLHNSTEFYLKSLPVDEWYEKLWKHWEASANSKCASCACDFFGLKVDNSLMFEIFL